MDEFRNQCGPKSVLLTRIEQSELEGYENKEKLNFEMGNQRFCDAVAGSCAGCCACSAWGLRSAIGKKGAEGAGDAGVLRRIRQSRIEGGRWHGHSLR